MSATSFIDLIAHKGHKIVCVTYGETKDNPQNVSLECEDCNEVLLSYDKNIGE